MKKKGQSTMEYVFTFSMITLTVVAAAYVALRPAVKKLVDNTAAQIEKEANILISQTAAATTTSGRSRDSSTTDGTRTDDVTTTYGRRDSRSGYSTSW